MQSLKNTIDDLLKIKEMQAELDKQYKEKRLIVINAIREKNATSDSEIKSYKSKLTIATLSQQVKIKYNLQQILSSKKIPKQIKKEITVTEYKIDDINKFKKYIVKLGADLSVIKEMLFVDSHLNKIRLEELFSDGELTLEMLQSCFEVTKTDILRIKRR